MSTQQERRANNALGICIIAFAFLFETTVAHQVKPNPASPYVWSALGLVFVASLAYYLKHRARR